MHLTKSLKIVSCHTSALWLTTDKVVTTSTAGGCRFTNHPAPSTQPHSYRARPLKLSDLAIGVRSTGYQVGWIILKKMAWLTIRKGTHCSLHIFHLYCIMESGWWYLIHDESCMRYVVYCCSMKVWLNYLSLNQCKFAVKSGTIIK